MLSTELERIADFQTFHTSAALKVRQLLLADLAPWHLPWTSWTLRPCWLRSPPIQQRVRHPGCEAASAGRRRNQAAQLQHRWPADPHQPCTPLRQDAGTHLSHQRGRHSRCSRLCKAIRAAPRRQSVERCCRFWMLRVAAARALQLRLHRMGQAMAAAQAACSWMRSGRLQNSAGGPQRSARAQHLRHSPCLWRRCRQQRWRRLSRSLQR